ncbi:MAG: hypothetical protein ACOYL7_12645 [Caldilinea sp.]
MMEFLGGGQTAAVYRARVLESKSLEWNGQEVAVKLMVAGLDRSAQIRFQEEIEVLRTLRNYLRDPKFSLVDDAVFGSWLIPDIIDHSEKPPVFIAMSIASGEPLDQILRDGWQELTEPEVLTIVYQLLTVFAALHEGLKRSYFDFQPHNVYWHPARQTITVIDWNLLSLAGQADEQADLTIAATLLHRLATGAMPFANTTASLARPQRWRELSLAMQSLLVELARPGGVHSASARTMRTRVAVTRQFWAQTGDQLLIGATQAAAAVEAMEKPSSKWEKIQHLALLLDLAERRTYSPAYAVLAYGLRNKLQHYSAAYSWIGRGRSFLELGELATAAELFVEAIRNTPTAAGQVTAWRWRVLATAAQQDFPGYQAVAKECDRLLTALNDIEGWSPVDASLILQALQRLGWAGMDPISREIEARITLHICLAFELAALKKAERCELEHWQKQLERSRGELDQLPGTLDGDGSYSAAAWALVSDGDSAAARKRVDARYSEVTERLNRLAQLDNQLAAVDSPGLAQRLFELPTHGEAVEPLTVEEATDPYLLSALVQRCSEWLTQPENDGDTRALLAILQSIAGRTGYVDLMVAVETLEAVYRSLGELQFWIDQVEGAVKTAATASAVPVATREEPATTGLDTQSGDQSVFAALTSPELSAQQTDVCGQASPIDTVQQHLLFVYHLASRITSMKASVPAAGSRLELRLGKLADIMVIARQSSKLFEKLLEEFAPELLKHRQDVLAVARLDQKMTQTLAAISGEIRRQELKATQLDAAIRAKESELQRWPERENQLRKRYVEREQQAIEDFTRKEQSRSARLRQQEEDGRRAFSELQQKRNEELRKIEEEKKTLLDEVKSLHVEKQALLGGLARPRSNIARDPRETHSGAAEKADTRRPLTGSMKVADNSGNINFRLWPPPQIDYHADTASLLSQVMQTSVAPTTDQLKNISQKIGDTANRLNRMFTEALGTNKLGQAREHLIELAVCGTLQHFLLLSLSRLQDDSGEIEARLQDDLKEIQDIIDRAMANCAERDRDSSKRGQH